MRERTVYVIYWDNYGQDAYLYGSGVTFLGDGSVLFENERMPSGYSIKKWSSQTSFLRDKCEPSLPLLQEGVRYMVRPGMQVSPPGTVLLRVEFFNRQRERISFLFSEGEDPCCEVPEGTWYYCLELVQSGSKKLHFYGILLCQDHAALRREIAAWRGKAFPEKAAQIGRRRMFWSREEGKRGRTQRGGK